jgi:N utilization substance protein A
MCLKKKVIPRLRPYCGANGQAVVVQRIRRRNAGVIYDEYIEKEYEVLTLSYSGWKRGRLVELGRTDGLLTPRDVQARVFASNDRLKVYVIECVNTIKGRKYLFPARTGGLVKRLFELEVPEIQSGIVRSSMRAKQVQYQGGRFSMTSR